MNKLDQVQLVKGQIRPLWSKKWCILLKNATFTNLDLNLGKSRPNLTNFDQIRAQILISKSTLEDEIRIILSNSKFVRY